MTGSHGCLQCPAYMFIVLVYNVQLDIQLPHSHNLVVGSAIQYDAQSSSSDVAVLINPTMRWPCHCAQPRFLGHLYLAFSHPSIALYYISLLPGLGNIDDQKRNLNINNRDHLVGQPTTPIPWWNFHSDLFLFLIQQKFHVIGWCVYSHFNYNFSHSVLS